jgi:hypothetical protein
MVLLIGKPMLTTEVMQQQNKLKRKQYKSKNLNEAGFIV